MTPSIITFTRRRVNPLHVRPEDVCLEDVAHHLALINRFNGALDVPYSVAQHSVYVSMLCEGTGLEREALMHDGGESFVGDVTKWLKESTEMEAFRAAEARAQLAVYAAFGITPYDASGHRLHPIIEEADQLMVRFEAIQFGITIPVPGYHPPSWEERKRIGEWKPWSWQKAEREFLRRFRSLWL